MLLSTGSSGVLVVEEAKIFIVVVVAVAVAIYYQSVNGSKSKRFNIHTVNGVWDQED